MTIATVAALVSAGSQLLQRLITEKRDPTPEEWAAVLQSIDQHRAEAKKLDTLG
jgi:hypothetical protein